MMKLILDGKTLVAALQVAGGWLPKFHPFQGSSSGSP